MRAGEWWRSWCPWLARCCPWGRRHKDDDGDDVLGTGSFGRVVRRWRVWHGTVAVKHVAFGTPSQRARARFEAELLRALDHPNVVRLLAYEERAREARLVLELGGSCLTHALLDASWERARVRPAFAQLAHAIEYLHARRVVHRDLKPDNLLLDTRGVLKVIDFGLSHVFERSADRVRHDAAGSAGYLAPELFCLTKAHDAYLADVWAMGMVFYAMLTCHRPFRLASPDDAQYAEVAAKQQLCVSPARSVEGGDFTMLESVVLDGTLAVDVGARKEAAWVAATVYVRRAR